MIKHIFSDMDGTLLTSKGEISNENIQAINNCPLPFTLVSARAPMEMQFAIDSLKLVTPQIAFNGGLIFQGKQILDEHPLEFPIAKMLLQKLSENYPKVSLSYYTEQDWYSEKQDAGIQLEQSLTHQAVQIVKFQEQLKKSQKIFKIMLILFDDSEIPQIANFLQQLKRPQLSIQQSGNNYLEITSAHAKKSNGLQFIIHQEQLEKSEIAALGDGHNDLPMLELAGTSIVMENAHPEVKAKATFITKSNDENGVAYALNHYI